MKYTFLIITLLLTVINIKSQISLTSNNFSDTQNFNTIASSGTSSTLPTGWAFAETGSNANTTYTASTGSDNAGDTYGFGQASNSERSLGGIQSGTLQSTIGVCYTNNTGSTIVQLNIAYRGETWRIGTINRQDGLQFEYNLNTTGITGSGTWTSVPALNYFNPGSSFLYNGGFAIHSSVASSVITGLNILPGETFCFRWNDFNASGADDGVAIDDYALSGLTSNSCGDADLSIIKTASNLTPDSAEVFTYTIAVTNNGPCDATGVHVRDSLTSQLNIGSSTGPGTFSSTYFGSYSIISWYNVTIPANTTASFTLNASSTASGSHGNFPFYMPNYVQIFTSNQPDPNSTPGNGYNGEDDDDDETVILREGYCTVAGNTTPAPPNVTITNSTCGGGCIPSAGSFAAPSGSPCTTSPYNSFYSYTLQYQENGGSWTATLPTYDQDGPPQTIKTRCNCNYNNFFSSDESAPVTTAPVSCSPPSCTITGDALVCSESTISYSAPAGMNTYSWSVSGDAMQMGASNNQSFSVIANATGTYTVSVTTTNGNGCSSTCNLPVTITTTFTTVNDGNYNNPTTWLGGCVPPNPLPMGVTVNIVNDVINPVGFTLTNNGLIVLGVGGSFINNGTYIGNGILNGTMVNNGTVSPGN